MRTLDDKPQGIRVIFLILALVAYGLGIDRAFKAWDRWYKKRHKKKEEAPAPDPDSIIGKPFAWKTDVPSPDEFTKAVSEAVVWAHWEGYKIAPGHSGVRYSYTDAKFIREEAFDTIDPLGAWLLQHQPPYKKLLLESPSKVDLSGFELCFEDAFKVNFRQDMDTSQPACIGAFCSGLDGDNDGECIWGDAPSWHEAGKKMRHALLAIESNPNPQ